ncbi:uncharacterized protein LOC129457092 [Periophthalmus magnuspinnatus]|uniref:uncharacterized protein LOC129457092 n=1 Tax=Periophthalmus magnuspinnatus TaxID=409849 RepID=UPI00243671C2|nr:uncharacterized protein LOC129457092 [Periophthalmus magnuspinnatus]
MKLHSMSVLLLVLCCGGPFTRAMKVLEVKEGEDLKFKCSFYTSGHWRVFCKNHCERTENYLLASFIDISTEGRYSIEFEKRPSYPDLLHVKIKNVQKSDAGSYSCALATWGVERVQFTYVDITIYVTSADSSGSVPGVPEGPSASKAQQNHTPLSDVALYVGLSLSAVLILSVTLTILYWRKRASPAPESPQTPGYAQLLKARLLTAPVVTCSTSQCPL